MSTDLMRSGTVNLAGRASAADVNGDGSRRPSNTAIRAAGSISLSTDRKGTRSAFFTQKAAPTPLQQLLAQKPHGFVQTTPRSKLTSQRLATMDQDPVMQEMSQMLAKSSSAAQLSAYVNVTDWSAGLAGASTTNLKDAQRQSGFREASPEAYGGHTLHQHGSDSCQGTAHHGGLSHQGTGLASLGLTRQATHPGNLTRQSTAFGATLASGLGGTKGSRFDPLLEEGQSTVNTGWAASPVPDKPRPSTRELLRSIRQQGREEVDVMSKHIAHLPRPSPMPTRSTPAAPSSMLRQYRSEPDLRQVSHETEASKSYRAEADRLLQRLMADVDISHSELPHRHAQQQVLSHLDKAHAWMKQSAAMCRSLEESAGSPKLKLRTSEKMPQAGLRLPAGSAPLPGSLKWEKPVEKKKPKRKEDDFDATFKMPDAGLESQQASRLASKEKP
eukprot:CAMPEP_0197659084 /NCGR_PEP_ID=MMETSP1338-20131121/46200_1 /TAXON_ID=43686 ORGANISM="Pelagodinium beii, Strain RCC1491" /NCGR_SAMPLE_ID=MMETSP1338 /ASSEMBLY_ACC=CAM_ASM_000754 /LENGTH=443 /DNA_ID=CAMNT_0043235841 /DNA_START=41 /DNA_END=1372 /DNA_ORIENTATION=+